MTNHGMKTMIYPVKDVTKTKALFAKLIGCQPVVDNAYYVGFKVGRAGYWIAAERGRTGNDGAAGIFSRRRHQESGGGVGEGRRAGAAGGEGCGRGAVGGVAERF